MQPFDNESFPLPRKRYSLLMLTGYKEMRREHQKLIQNLEAKCKAEEQQCTHRIQQEYENERARATKEETKAKQGDLARLQQKVTKVAPVITRRLNVII